METRLNRNLGKITHFFITSMLTLVMSTFWLNSGGNLVCRSSFLSTGVAIARRERLREVERRGRNARVEGANMSTARWSVRHEVRARLSWSPGISGDEEGGEERMYGDTNSKGASTGRDSVEIG